MHMCLLLQISCPFYCEATVHQLCTGNKLLKTRHFSFTVRWTCWGQPYTPLGLTLLTLPYNKMEMPFLHCFYQRRSDAHYLPWGKKRGLFCSEDHVSPVCSLPCYPWGFCWMSMISYYYFLCFINAGDSSKTQVPISLHLHSSATSRSPSSKLGAGNRLSNGSIPYKLAWAVGWPCRVITIGILTHFSLWGITEGIRLRWILSLVY